jgi:hypothetical protein
MASGLLQDLDRVGFGELGYLYLFYLCFREIDKLFDY